MKKYLIVLLLLLLAIPAEAAEFVTTQDDGGVLTVTAEAEAGKNVHLQVLRADMTDEDLKNCAPEELASVIAFEQTVTANSSGKAIFRFKLDGDSGTYQMKVRAYGEDGEKPYLYTYVSLDNLKKIVKAVIDAKSEDEVKAALTAKNLADLGVNSPLTGELNLSGMYRRIFKVRDILDSEKPSELVGLINEALVLEGLAQRAITNPLLYDAVLHFSTQPSYATYDKMTETNKGIVSGKLLGVNYESVADAQKQFCEQTVLTAVEKLEYWKGLGALLKENNGYLEIDFSVYDSRDGETYEIDSQLAGKSFSSTEALKKEWVNLLNKPSKTDSSGGGGGSRSKGGSYSVQNPYPELLENDDTIVRPHVDFVDMDSAEWAKESVEYLYIRNVVNGVDGRHFEPNAPVKREEFAKMLVCALGLYDSQAMSDFTDSDYFQWHYSYISSAYHAGIIAGLGNGAFGVGSDVSRQDMAVMCYRAARVPSGYSSYADAAKIAPYAAEAVGALTANGILSGADNQFRPNDSATRAEAAKIIHKIMLLKEAK